MWVILLYSIYPVTWQVDINLHILLEKNININNLCSIKAEKTCGYLWNTKVSVQRYIQRNLFLSSGGNIAFRYLTYFGNLYLSVRS